MPDMNKPNGLGKTIKDYLPAAMQVLRGRQESVAPMKQPVDKDRIREAVQTLKDYKQGKATLENRIIEEELWWKLRHWDVVRNKAAVPSDPAEVRPEPTSAWLFNSLHNKHADIMDNYPEPNVLPRERQDEQDADTLSSILPVVFERNHYEDTYSDAAWYKLKHGVVAKGVFWNNQLEDGLGDIDIRFIDLLNIFWEPGITDLQQSRNLFVVDLKENEVLEQQYPQLKGKLGGEVIQVEDYIRDDTVDTTTKSVVVDWYYKVYGQGGKPILHYCKFVGDEILFASENEAEYQDGFYEHGKYPIVFDVLFPEEGTPVGFGYISVMKSPQMYIDKLSQAIMEHSVMCARPRFWGKKQSNIDEQEFLDWNKPIVHYEGDEANIRPLDIPNLSTNVLNVLQMKIDELKETSSNRDVSQGSSSGGVTAAAAIAALQEAGNKTSRDMIAASYRSYTQECYLAIELIRQFYDEVRSFRITGKTGKNEYIEFSNASLQPQALPPAYEGQEMEPGYTPATRRPIFDVVIRPQKRSPYSKMAQNELAKELMALGVFNPANAEQSLGLLEMMDFDGIEKVRDRVQQGQTLMSMMMQMQQELMKLRLIVQGTYGIQPPEAAASNPMSAQGDTPVPHGKSMGSAVTDAQGATMTSYGQKLAAQAKPDMNRA